MKINLLCLFALWLITSTSYAQVDPQVQQIINQVNLDSLTSYVEELSGQVPIVINGKSYTIQSRHKNYPGNKLAADYIAQKFKSFGLVPEYLNYSITGRDVFAIQWGTDYPDQKYIICAHYDSMPNDSLSPGADDNASGIAAVLEAARILSQYTSKYTIIYALWDEEEQGMVGSLNWVYQAFNADWIITGAINIDMIGWDSDDDHKLWINTKDIGNSIMLSDKALEVNAIYQLGLDPQVLNPGYGSDNRPFWDYGYGAIGVEEFYGTDWNDYYHTQNDKLNKFNLPYFQKCVRMIVGTLASITDLNQTVYVSQEKIIPKDIMLSQNYPNPFNPSTVIKYSVPEQSLVTIKIFDIIGNEVETLVNEEKPVGRYEVNLSANNLASGVYFYQIKAGKYIETKKMTLIK